MYHKLGCARPTIVVNFSVQLVKYFLTVEIVNNMAPSSAIQFLLGLLLVIDMSPKTTPRSSECLAQTWTPRYAYGIYEQISFT